jgi:tetratricopeptide (TPR) repeat protein
MAQRIARGEPKTDPNIFWAHNLIGWILLEKQHKLDEAAIEFGNALAFKPKHPLAYAAFAMLARPFVNIDAKYAVPHNNLGNVFDKQGKSAEAIAEYNKAIDLDPKDAAPHNNLGNVFDKQGKSAEAIAEYNKAIDLDPKDAYPHNGLGAVFDKQGKSAEAIAEFEKASKISSGAAHGDH